MNVRTTSGGTAPRGGQADAVPAGTPNNLGLVFERVGKLDEAVGWYERATALEPDNPMLVGNLARAKVRRGNRGEDVQGLLANLISKDTREEWIALARARLAFLRSAER